MINTEIEKLKKEIAELINTKLQAGIPISVVKLVMEGMLMEVNSGVKLALEQEAKQLQQQKETEANQVEWVEPEQPEDAEVVE